MSSDQENLPEVELFQQVFDEQRNIFLTGAGGTGKSWLINRLKKEWKETLDSSEILAITSTTGVSAISLGAKTIHSWAGIKKGELGNAELLKRVRNSPTAVSNWKMVKYLVIDEISMLSKDVFDKLNFIAKRMKKNRKEFFGGIGLIVTGDPLQLPPVDGEWFFMADAWMEGKFYPIVLDTPHRYPSMDWYKLLMRARRGKCSKSDIAFLKNKVVSKVPNTGLVKPTILNSLRKDVYEMNMHELDKIPENRIVFKCTDNFVSTEIGLDGEIVPKRIDRSVYSRIMDGSVAQEFIMKIGAQVMLLINLSLEEGLCNGSRGVVTDIGNDSSGLTFVEIQWVNGRTTKIFENLYEFEDEVAQVKYTRLQFPLALAFSVSIHRCCTGNTLIYTENGIKRISRISNQRDEFQKTKTTLDINLGVMGKTGINTATQIYKGEIEETIIITTSLGYTIEGSNRHPIMTYDGDEVWKKLPDIKIGEFVMLKNEAECYGENPSTESYVHPTGEFVKYTIPKVVDETLAYLIGVLIGDGCYSTKNDYPIEISILKTSEIMIDCIQDFFYKNFGSELNVYSPKSNPKISKLMINSKHVRTFLLWCGLGYEKCYTKTIPWCVLENTKEAQIACVRGLFDTDGGVNKACVHFTTVSHQLAIDTQNLLLNLGIICSLVKMNGKSREKYAQAYRLQICGYNAHLFYTKIGFVEETKQLLLKNKYGIYDHPFVKTNTCEIPLGKELIKSLHEELSHGIKNLPDGINKNIGAIFSRVITGKSKLRFHQLKFICDNIKSIETYKTGEKLYNMYKNSQFFDKIVNIERGKSQLYDIFVPNDHSFMGNGIVNHNSQGQTLDCVACDVGTSVFEFGQGYTALSRVRDPENLYLTAFDERVIKADPDALAFDDWIVGVVKKRV